jgi:hypothetical protein
MDKNKIIYVSISAVCILAIIAAIFAQIDQNSGKKNHNNNNNSVTEETKTQEELKKEFNSLFNNTINTNNYNTSAINKQDENKEIVYTAYDIEKAEENKYEVDIHLPVFNINSSVTSGFNSITQKVFADKATEVLNNNNGSTIIYSIDYTGYINGDTLSLIIRSTLKEGTNAQRVIVQTYNYNLQTDKEVSIYDAIEQRGVAQSSVSSKITSQITQAIKEANSIQISGFDTYKRDINSDIYHLDKTDNFFIGKEGKLYIIYAYGNNNFTSEMDIIEI